MLFNKYQFEIKNQLSYSIILGCFCGLGLMGYYIINKPLTKSLYLEAFKSFVFGNLVGFSYNRV
jgi:hypothetical protein